MDEIKLAWAGGFFSGEGCTILHVHKTRRERPYPSVHINHTSVEELERFNNAIGGLGKILGPYQPANKLSKKQRYDINCYGYEKTKTVIDMLWPYLSSAKQKQASRVLKTYEDYVSENSIS